MCIRDSHSNAHVAQSDLHLSGLQPGNHQNIVDEGGHVGCLLLDPAEEIGLLILIGDDTAL